MCEMELDSEKVNLEKSKSIPLEPSEPRGGSLEYLQPQPGASMDLGPNPSRALPEQMVGNYQADEAASTFIE